MSSLRSSTEPLSFGKASVYVPNEAAKQLEALPVRDHHRAEFSEKFALQLAESRALAKQRSQSYIYQRLSNRGIYLSECERLGIPPDAGFAATLNATPCEYDLQALDLRGRGLTSLEAFLDLVRMNKRLQRVDVAENALRNEDLGMLADVLKLHPSVREVCAAGNRDVVYAPGLLQLFHELARRCPSIRTIELQPPAVATHRAGAHDTLQGWLGSRPENILFFIEQHNEMLEPVGPHSEMTRLHAVKRALHVFIQAKQQMNPNHGFCLCGLKERAVDLAPFENSFETPIPVLAKRITDLQIGKEEFGALDFTSVLEVCEEKMEECRIAPNTGLPHIFRAVVVLGRSNSSPTLTANATATRVLQSPNFFLDIVFVHRPVNETTYYQMQEVFHAIVDVSKRASTSSYVFEAAPSAGGSRRTDRLAQAFGTLLAHPLQRPYHQTKCKTALAVTRGEDPADARPALVTDTAAYLALRTEGGTAAASTEAAAPSGVLASVAVTGADWSSWRDEEVKYTPPTAPNPRRKVALRRKLRRPAEVEGMVDDKFRCGVCGDLFNQPVQNSYCGDRYCAVCIEEHLEIHAWCPFCRRKMDRSQLVQPKEAFLKALGAIPCACGYGCGRRMTVAERPAHAALCENLLLTCPADECDWFGKRSEVVAHFAACRFRRVRCGHCGSPEIRYADLEQHLCRACPRYAVTCTRCNTPVVRTDLEFHVQHQCFRTDIGCLHAHLGCTHRCAREQMKYHLVDSCIFNKLLVTARQYVARIEDTATTALEQGLPYLHTALMELAATSFSLQGITANIHRHFSKYDSRQSLTVALVRVFGVPLEFDSDYHNICFLFCVDATQPFLLFCHLSPEYPAEPPILLMSSIVYTEREQEMPLPARCKLQKFEFSELLSADAIAANIHRKLYNSVGSFDRLCGGKDYTDT